MNHAGWNSLWPETNPMHGLASNRHLTRPPVQVSPCHNREGRRTLTLPPSAQLRPPQLLCVVCSSQPHPPVTLASCSCRTGPHLCPGLCQLSTELAPALPLIPYSDTTHPGRLLPAQDTAWPRLPDSEVTKTCQPCTTYSFPGCHRHMLYST